MWGMGSLEFLGKVIPSVVPPNKKNFSGGDGRSCVLGVSDHHTLTYEDKEEEGWPAWPPHF